MSALIRDLALSQTATFQPSWPFDSKAGTFSPTGYTGWSQWRTVNAVKTVVAELSTQNGGILIDATAKTLSLSIPDETRDALFAAGYSRLDYDLFVTAPSGKTYGLMRGQILLERTVTHSGD